MADSAAENYLKRMKVHTVTFDDIDGVMRSVAGGKAAAAVYDEPILKYELHKHPKLQILPGVFERRDYAIALPLRSPLRKEINISMLKQIQSDLWRLQVEDYLGKP